jgi:hypothetical protein
MDTVGSERAALYGCGMTGQVALLFAALHPDRVTALILHSTVARHFAAVDYPWGAPVGSREGYLERVRSHWGDLDHPFGLRTLAASRAAEPGFARMFARVQQVSASRSAAVAERRVFVDSDLCDDLPLVQVPMLITFTEAAPSDRDAGRYLAAHITDARVVTQPGVDLYPGPDDVGVLGVTLEEFLTGVRPAVPADRVLAAVLFTDIAASTERVAAIGDRAWRGLLDRFRTAVRDELHRFRGREISTRGDDSLATFDGPARAIRCAFAIRAAVAHLDIDVRSGLHT